jgi:hypothetical protein
LVLDLDSGAVVFVGKKGGDALKPFWKRLWGSARQDQGGRDGHVSGLPGGCFQCLPKAKIVFDHFHVIKLFNEKLSDLRTPPLSSG